jgi:hypothetical protein
LRSGEGDPCFGDPSNLCALVPEAAVLAQYNANLSRLDIRWSHDSPNAVYSLDVKTTSGEEIAPCVGAAIVGHALAYRYDGICNSTGLRRIPRDQLASVRVCGSSDGWASSSCSIWVTVSPTANTVPLKVAPPSAEETYLAWNPVPGAVYSVDVQTHGGSWVAPCANAGAVGSATSYTLGSTCVSAGNLTVPKSSIHAVRVCASTDQWTTSKCAERVVASDPPLTYPTILHFAL